MYGYGRWPGTATCSIPAIRSGDTVVITGGVYHQAPALRHKEILAAMGRCVTVIGAASIGALRDTRRPAPVYVPLSAPLTAGHPPQGHFASHRVIGLHRATQTI